MKDYITKHQRLSNTLKYKERTSLWWKWKGKDIASVLAFILLVVIITFVLPE